LADCSKEMCLSWNGCELGLHSSDARGNDAVAGDDAGDSPLEVSDADGCTTKVTTGDEVTVAIAPLVNVFVSSMADSTLVDSNSSDVRRPV
jgi:hypothetical protein